MPVLSSSALTGIKTPVDHREGVGFPAISFFTTYEEAVLAAQREGKPLLLVFTLPSCANSQRMLETTFQDNEIRRLAQRFVCVIIDATQNSPLSNEFEVQSFPTIIIKNVTDGEIQRVSGKQSVEQLSVRMLVAIQSTASQSSTINRKVAEVFDDHKTQVGK